MSESDGDKPFEVEFLKEPAANLHPAVPIARAICYLLAFVSVVAAIVLISILG